MKRHAFIALLLLLAGTALADSHVTVSPVEIPSGKEAELTLNFDFDEGHTICNYQMELQLPEGVSVVGNGVTLGDCHSQFHSGSIVNNIIVVSSNPTTVLTGTSGELLKVRVTADANLTAGTILQGTLHNVKLGQTNETSINPDDLTFDISIVERLTVVLDETSTTAPTAAEDVNVRVKRTIQANEWSTICLPFTMTEAQCKAAFGDDVELGDFTGYETELDGDDNIIGITVNFNDATAIEANHPYIIKVSSAITEFTVEQVNIDPEEEPTVAAVKRTKKQWSEMTGTYVANTVLEATNLFLSGNKFWYSAGQTKMKAFRAYFDFYDVLTEVEDEYTSRIMMSFDDENTTGIDAQRLMDNGRQGVYDLQGRRLDSAGSGSSLKKGLYIVNGKKVVVKRK